MEPDHGTHKVSKFELEDVISNMPENVLTNILDRLPIQNAVWTSILSKNWRFKWTTLTQLIFDVMELYKLDRGGKIYYDGRNLSRLLLHFSGVITKFELNVPGDKILDEKDIHHWVMFLSRKGIKDFTLINMHKTPLKLPTHIFSCLELKHLKLRNCCVNPTTSFRGFPDLLSLDLYGVRFESGNCGEFISWCPLLEILKISYHDPIGKVKLVEIAKLENLKILYLPLCNLDNTTITRSTIFQLAGILPKLQELYLDFQKCELAKPDAGDLTAFSCLKTLTLYSIDFGSIYMLVCTVKIIFRSPNLQTLNITAAYKSAVLPPELPLLAAICSILSGQLRLRNVVFSSFRGSVSEVRLIKYLLAHSPFLKKIIIRPNSSKVFGGTIGKLMFATNLLKLRRASPTAELDLHWS